MILLVDCGNTQAKWRLIHAEGELAYARDDYPSWQNLRSTLAQTQAGHKGLQVIYASVTAVEVLAQLKRTLADVGYSEAQAQKANDRSTHVSFTIVEVEPEFAGLSIAYDDKTQLGVDRWLSMLALPRPSKRSSLLVSVGTAVTVDKIDPDGRHLGGLIAPGWRLLKESLASQTERLGVATDLNLAAGDPLLGTNTLECLESGVSLMLLAFISDAVRRFGGEHCDKFIVGGDAALLASALPQDFLLREHLVLDGLDVFRKTHKITPN